MAIKIIPRLVIICFISLLVLTVFPRTGEAEKTIILISTEEIKNSTYGKWLSLIYTEVFHRLGYELQYDGYPAARASMMSDKGIVDGEICRVFEYQEAHPNVIRVEEAAFSSRFVAMAVKPGIELQGWKSLQGTAFRVEYRRGSKLPGFELPKVVAPEHLSKITTVEQGLKKLIMGRSDLYVDSEGLIAETIKSLKRDNFNVSTIYKAGIMQGVNVHVYLHKKHAALVPKVTHALKTLKQEGLVEHYRKIVFE